jgi:hypothetical protein
LEKINSAAGDLGSAIKCAYGDVESRGCRFDFRDYLAYNIIGSRGRGGEFGVKKNEFCGMRSGLGNSERTLEKMDSATGDSDLVNSEGRVSDRVESGCVRQAQLAQTIPEGYGGDTRNVNKTSSENPGRRDFSWVDLGMGV